MPFEEVKPTRVEWWPLPRPGEIVPDYPPQDITSCFASVSLDPPTVADWAEEQLGVPLDPFQREVVNRMFRLELSADVSGFAAAVGSLARTCEELAYELWVARRARRRRIRRTYRQRLLARKRRRR